MADEANALSEEDWIALMVAWNKVATEEGISSGDIHAMIGLLRSHWNLLTDIEWVREKARDE